MFTATEAVPVAKVVAGNKRYPGVVALDNVNFMLNKGEVRALLGKNGAGKSTLIRMLTGSERPDSGDIWIGETRLEGDEATLTRRAAELGVRAVYQELSLVEGLTVAENLCLGQWPRRNGMIDYLQMAQDAQRCLQALGVDVSPEQLVSTLSPAQKQLVEIARVMKGEPRVVILDEPTSSLASAEVELVISAVKKMSALGVAVIYVSHRMEEIRRIASCATVMRDGQVAGDVMLENTSTHHIVSLMLGRDHVDIAPVAPQEIVDQAVLEVRALRHKPKLEDISFTLRRGEVLGIAGLLGAGRSELLNAPGFISLNNQMNVLRDAATIGIAAWAMTLIIISGEIDVSVGPMVAFVSVCLAFLLQFEVPLAVACLLVLLLGALMGTLAGVLRGVFNVPSFVATLGLWSALRGMGLFMTNALPVPIDENEVLDWLGGQFLGVPVSALIMIVLFALFVFISRKTAFGRSVFAVGGNATAAQLCGINVRRVRILIFTLSGLLAAVTGILLAARLGSGNAGAANGLEFDVIAAVVVGGTALSGGRGSLFGTLLGVLVITLIGNGLVLLGINSFFQQVVRGVIIVVAVLANILLTQRSSKAKR